MMTLDDYVALPRVATVAVAPDGTWLAVAVQQLDSSGAKFTTHLWRVPVDGGEPRALTRGDARHVAPAFRHDGALAFLSNRRANDASDNDETDKRLQVWALPAEGGEPVRLTDEPLGVEAFACARDHDRMVVFAPVLPGVEHDRQREVAADRAKHGPTARRYTAQPSRHWDHWLHDARTGARAHLVAYVAGERHDLTPDADFEFAIEPALDIARDGRLAVATCARRSPIDRESETLLAVFDLDTRKQVRVVDPGPRSEFDAPHFAPDGRSIASVLNVRRDGRLPLRHLAIVDAHTGAVRPLAADWDAWPHVYGWTHDARTVIAGADHRGRSAVFGIDLATQRVDRWIEDGSVTQAVAIDGQRLAGVRSTVRSAPEVFVASMTVQSTPAARTAFAHHPALPDVTVEAFDTPSTDGTPVQSYLIKPAHASGPLPVVMFIHGGPIGAFGDQWHWRWNPLLLAARGIAVVMPNPRGSTGYGRDFIEGIWGNRWGAQCYEDLMAVADAVAARPDIDGTRFAAMGGSFGGYMSNWIGTQTTRFKCLITHASIFWMQAFTGTTDHPPYWLHEMNATPDTPAAEFDRYSPSAFAARWKTPVLIIHGEKDYRCPISESLMLHEALQQRGVPSELLVFPDENHWILRPRNVIAWYDAVTTFLDHHLH